MFFELENHKMIFDLTLEMPVWTSRLLLHFEGSCGVVAKTSYRVTGQIINNFWVKKLLI
jgi:hypothetical protein